MKVVGLVLAAGAGRRFGGAKAVATLDGERLVDRAVRTLREAGVDEVYVVSGAVPLDVPGGVVIDNPEWSEGIGSSLRAGLAALDRLPADVVAAVVVPVDQPGLSPAAVARLVDAVEGDTTLAVATYSGRQGHPVVLGRAHWARAARQATGDVGARAFLRRAEASVSRLECADVASGEDVDTPAALARHSAGSCAPEPQLHDQREERAR
jgi:nicotine blue oxidoreductase